jgi:hypothetical protein
MVIEERVLAGDKITLPPQILKEAFLKSGELVKIITTNHGILIMPKSLDIVDVVAGIFPSSKRYDEGNYYTQLRMRNE